MRTDTDCNTKAAELQDVAKHIHQQLALTDDVPELGEHRELVEKRLLGVQALCEGSASPSKLSPGARKIKEDFFQPPDGKFSEQSLKAFQKKFKGMIQLVSNASEGLHATHAEICTLLT